MRSIKRWVSLAFTILLIILFSLNPFWLPEYRMQDLVYQRPGLINTDIVIIGIDEWALDTLGQFPWSRHIWADVLNILNRHEDARPAVIAIDVLFDQPSWDWEADDALVEAVARSDNIVLASLFDVGFDFDSYSLDMIINDHIMSFPELQPYAPHGLINGYRGRDGVIRNALLRMPFQGDMYYSLAVEAAMKYTGLPVYDLIDWRPDGYISSYINFTGLPGDFFQYSVADVFEDWFDPSWLAGRAVLIGPWALGMMDSHSVPIDHSRLMYGVEIHANVLQMVIEGNFKQNASGQTAFIIVAALIIAAMLIGEFFRMRITAVLFFICGAGYFFTAVQIFNNGYVLPVLTPLLALFIVFLYQFSYGYAINALEKARMRNTFRKYVDPKLVDQLIKSKEANIDEMGQKKHIAVIFVDVRNFTPMTESLKETPEVIVETLNSYLELTASSIFNNGGSVDKFIGDATMGLFNGFVPLDDYVYKAVKAACDMVDGAQAVSTDIKKRTGIDLGFGIGIHCGDAFVGNLGPSFRKDFTAIGDVVNTASRLESNAAQSQILVSRDVYEIIKNRATVVSVGEIHLKGKSMPMEVFEVIGVN